MIGHYRMGFTVTPHDVGSLVGIFIDDDLPGGFVGNLLGGLFAGSYAECCLRQMTEGL